VSDQLPVENSGLMARIAAATNRADRGDQNALAVIGQVFDLVPYPESRRHGVSGGAAQAKSPLVVE
jgi:hypothetical protein